MASHSKFHVGDIVETTKYVQWYSTKLEPGTRIIMIAHHKDKAGTFTGLYRGKMLRCEDSDFKLFARAKESGDAATQNGVSKEVPADLAGFRARLVDVVRKHLAHGEDLSEDDSTLLTDILALLGMKTRVVRKIELIPDEG